jgi:RimJ/RimL family protein N-acetyltransferase
MTRNCFDFNRLPAKCVHEATEGRRFFGGFERLEQTGVSDWQIVTARTIVRPAVAADAAALHDSRSQMPFDPQTRSRSDTEALIAAMAGRSAIDAAGWQQFAVRARDDGRFLGDIGVNFDTPRNRQAEIGFAFAPAARRQGFATEAVGAMVDWLFSTGRHRLVAQTDMRNIATQRLLERLRFRREAVHLQSWEERGQWFDEIAYARLWHE